MTKKTICLLWLVLLVGCPAAPQVPGPSPITPPPVADVTASMRAARAAADALYRDRLLEIAAGIAAGTIEYDTKLQLELTNAAKDCGQPIRAEFAKRLTTGGKIAPEQRETLAQTLRQLADAYQ